MSDVSGAFDSPFVFTATTSGARGTTSGFETTLEFNSGFFGSVNSLHLTVNAPGTFGFSEQSPGSLTLTPSTPGSL